MKSSRIRGKLMRLNVFGVRAKTIVVVGVAVVATGCGAATTPTKTNSSGTVTVLIPAIGNAQWTPRDAGDPYQEDALVLAPLLQADPTTGELEPGIAQSWTISPDGLTWTFTIRKGVMFQNNEPVTVADVVFSLEDSFGPGAIADPNTPGVMVSIGQKITSIAATGADTLAVVFKTPVPYFGSAVSSEIAVSLGGGIFPKAYFQSVGRAGFDKAPIGAGPWKLVSQNANEEVFQRFNNYYLTDELPKFTKLIYEAVPEEATRIVALQSGQADIVAADVSTENQIKGFGDSIAISPEASYDWMSFLQCWVPTTACHDVRVRQALDYALDKKTIMTGLYGDSWSDKGWVLAIPGSIGYTPDLAPRPYDVPMAKQLLAAAGYPGGKGFPTLTLSVDSDSAGGPPNQPELAELAAQDWRQNLGINVTIQEAPFNTLDGEQGTKALQGHFYIRGNGTRQDGGPLLFSLYGPGEDTNPNVLSEDPTVAAAMAPIQTALTPAARDAAYNNAYETAEQATYEVGVGTVGLVWGVATDVHGWQPQPVAAFPSAFWTITLG
jgi:peptide/nickel transport system substrate-binding protein